MKKTIYFNSKQLQDLKEYMPDDKPLANKIIDSFEMLYKNDISLINRFPSDLQDYSGHHVGERAIVFRFAHYLLNHIDNDYNYKKYDLDCEYNRNNINNKDLPEFPYGTYPDLIIHKRESNDHNLLIMEFKTWWNKNNNRDIKKIQGFMQKSGEYKYKYGLAVIINQDNVNIKCIRPVNE